MIEQNNQRKIEFLVLKNGKLYKADSIEDLVNILPDNFYLSNTDRTLKPKYLY